MIFNYKQLVQHNKNFYDAFVDLKLVGWNTYSKSLNAYTMNFYAEQLTKMDKEVENLALTMKGKSDAK